MQPDAPTPPDCCVLLDVTKETVSKIIIAKPFNCSEKGMTGKQSASVFPRSSVAAKYALGISFIRQNFQKHKWDWKSCTCNIAYSENVINAYMSNWQTCQLFFTNEQLAKKLLYFVIKKSAVEHWNPYKQSRFGICLQSIKQMTNQSGCIKGL